MILHARTAAGHRAPPCGAGVVLLEGVALRRNGWLLVGSDRGARRQAVAIAPLQTVKLKSAEPTPWLTNPCPGSLNVRLAGVTAATGTPVCRGHDVVSLIPDDLLEYHHQRSRSHTQHDDAIDGFERASIARETGPRCLGFSVLRLKNREAVTPGPRLTATPAIEIRKFGGQRYLRRFGLTPPVGPMRRRAGWSGSAL